MSKNNNLADRIERYLREDGHRTWGFVIYRCTYESGAEWDLFMDRFRSEIRRSFEYYNGVDILDQMSMTVISDRSALEHASTFTVRENFRQWSATAPQQEQAAGPALSQRYRYCIQMDEGALRSVIEGPAFTPQNPVLDGYVKLIWKDWLPAELDDEQEEEEEEEEIKGCTLHDVGWMKVSYQVVIPDIYYYLRDFSDWYREYRRPPAVVVM